MTRYIYRAMAVLTVVGASLPAAHAAGSGAVFVMTNAAEKNEVIAYARDAAGRLEERAEYFTEGRGSGGVTDPLSSQGALTLSPDGARLYAVNAGSGTVSTFWVDGANLALAGQVPSGGSEPVAVTQFGRFVYVLNAGAEGDIGVFEVGREGRLRPIADATKFLSANYTGGASISVRPDGKFLAVVERVANTISIFPVHADGTLGAIVSTPSPAPGAFSGLFAPDGELLVTETGPAGGTNASAFSAYKITGTGGISAVSQSVPTYGNGNCWSAITPSGQFVYTANSASSDLAGFSITKGGTLTPVGSTIVGTLPAGSVNLEDSLTADGKFLYTLNSGTGKIGIFAVNGDGTLTEIGEHGGLKAAAGYEGLASY